MKLPSINYLITNSKNSFIRFPLTIISSLIAAVLGIYLIEHEKEIADKLPYINVLLCMSIGIPLYFCVSVISIKRGFDKNRSVLANILATLILVAIYFTLPDSESTHNTSLPYIKYAIYNITCHLLVSFLPFIFNRQLNAFWNYNKTLFIRFLTSVLYSAFIYIGLIIALTSLRLLFDVKIHEQLYIEIWIATMCFFNTWFFVGGIPSDLDQLDAIEEYPKGLRIFSQYVLLPLLGLYLLILYSYGTKIVLLWDWPKGIVSYLIICISVLGILTFLLLHPYGNQKENAWIKKASRGYYFVLIPLLVILFIAIFMRVNDYGITINRYVIIILGVWLSIVCLYTAIGKTNIKFIPASLAILLILISFGPWGMFSVSERSQVNRLQDILEESKILAGNKIENEIPWIPDSLPELHTNSKFLNESLLNDSLHNEVKSILDYLDDHHGFSMIREWYKQDIDSIVNLHSKKDGGTYYNEAEIYMKTMGLHYSHKESDIKKTGISYNAGFTNSISKVSGYDYLVDFSSYQVLDDKSEIVNFYIDSTEYILYYTNKPEVELSLKSKADTVYFDFEGLLQKLKQEYGNDPESVLPLSKMQVEAKSDELEIKIEFHTIEMESGNAERRYNNLTGEIFIKRVDVD